MLANVLCALITFLFITDIAHIENVRQCGWQGAVRGDHGECVMAALLIRLGVVVGVAVAGAGTTDTVTRVAALLGGTVRLPCDTAAPSPHHPLLLTVWFKDQIQDPIYR